MSLDYKMVKESNAVADWVKLIKGKSGVYIIRERGFLGNVLYVGESHTGRLYQTLLRHFQKWSGPTAGPTFDPSVVEVAIVRTPPKKALETQNAVITEYEPELNVIGKPRGFWETFFTS